MGAPPLTSSAGCLERSDPQPRRSQYRLLLLIAVSIVGGRLLTAPGSFSPNDQSRWATIRALVETGSYAVGTRELSADGRYRDTGVITLPGWRTLDLVMHPDTRRFYSSKPPLLPTVVAGEYWVLRSALGLNLRRNRLAVTRIILFTINLLPFVAYLVCLARLLDRLGTTDWGRAFVFTTAGFGTFVSGYLASLNNHTVAAMAVLGALYQCVCIQLGPDRRPRRFLLAGVLTGWAACNELPAAAFAVAVGLWLVWRFPREALRFSAPALLLPVAAALLAQYLAVGTIVPTYAHEAWYQFQGSYWRQPGGIDLADEPKLLYAFNLLIGHTGILSLTPVLIIAWIGMVRAARADGGSRTPEKEVLAVLARLTILLTITMVAFYVARTNNYGGVTAGPRWFIWLVPLWLLTMVPEVDRWAGNRRRRILAAALLAFSIGTATHALDNPWQPSWLFTWFRDWGLIAYD